MSNNFINISIPSNDALYNTLYVTTVERIVLKKKKRRHKDKKSYEPLTFDTLTIQYKPESRRKKSI